MSSIAHPPNPRTAEPNPLGGATSLGGFGYVKSTIHDFIENDCTTMGAALAYYTTFSLPPLLLTVIAVAGLFFGREVVQGRIEAQIQGLIGGQVGEQISTMIRSVAQNKTGGLLSGFLGVLALMFGATTSFAQLQSALNSIWQVKPDPRAGGVRTFLSKRLLSFGMVLGTGFLLLVSLALSAALAAFGEWIDGLLPGTISSALVQALNFGVSFVVITGLFAAIFKVLPDAEIEWREVWVGGAITSLLFTVGKSLIGLYLGKSGAASAYGAAGSLVLIVLWIYYASLILLMGAEFTKVWTEAHGKRTQPEPGAMRVVVEEKQFDRSGAQTMRRL